MPLTSQVGRAQICSSRNTAAFAGRNLKADLAQKGVLRRISARAHCALISAGRSGDAVVEIRQGDAAVLVVQVGDQLRQHMDRIDRRAADTCRNAGRGSPP